MRTICAFLAVLYLTEALHIASSSSAAFPSNSTPTPHNKGVVPRTTQERATRQLQSRRNNTSKADDDSEASTADLPAEAPKIRYKSKIHHGGHGTRASRVPVKHSNRPIFGWHTTVYMCSQLDMTYEQICGGSLVKKDTAISAAHCFWDEAGLMPAEQFAVTVGQSRRRWREVERYRSNVSEIIIPPRFLGITTNFQDDIAVLRLATPVDYQFGVKPVCVNFDLELERSHLRNDNSGLITGFGLTEENGLPSEVLNYQLLPYVDIRACIAASDPGFLKYLTSDKICAGDQKTGRALCRGDSGGGLVFFVGPIETAVMYLRGVASAAPRNNNACNAYAIGSFTHVRTHRTFLRDNIPGLEEECEIVYAEELKSDRTDELKPNKPADNKADNEDSKLNESRESGNTEGQPGNTETQEVTGNPGVQFVSTNGPTEANESTRLVPNADQSPNLNKPNELHGPLKGPTKPFVSIPDGNNQEDGTALLSEVKVRGNPNTNIFFFTGPVVEPNRVYSQANATPVVVNSSPGQPTNIYVFILN